MPSLKICLFLVGVIYLFFGVAGLFPSNVYLPPPRLRYYDMYIIGEWGYLFTWLPVNLTHDIVYIIIGSIAVVSCPLKFTAIWGARGLFFLSTALAIIGFLPFGIAELWGFMPLFDWNIMLHTCTAVLLYYFGFVYPLDLGGAEPKSEMLTVET